MSSSQLSSVDELVSRARGAYLQYNDALISTSLALSCIALTQVTSTHYSRSEGNSLGDGEWNSCSQGSSSRHCMDVSVTADECQRVRCLAPVSDYCRPTHIHMYRAAVNENSARWQIDRSVAGLRRCNISGWFRHCPRFDHTTLLRKLQSGMNSSLLQQVYEFFASISYHDGRRMWLWSWLTTGTTQFVNRHRGPTLPRHCR